MSYLALVNPRHACAARVRYLLCVCVTALAATPFVSVCNQRHLHHPFRLFLAKLVDFRKTLLFKSYAEKKPVCKLVIAHREPFSRTTEAQPVSRILLQTLATGTAGVKQARKSGCVDCIRLLLLSTHMR